MTNWKRPEYRVWINMKTRCYDKNTPYYKTWGGRGISVCEKWRNSFEAFFSEVGPRPTKQHSLDRYPNMNGNYEPGNVRWATRKQQLRNVRDNRIVEVGGKHITLAEAAEGTGLLYNTILYRLKRGWSIEAALKHPPHKGVRP